MEVVSLPSVTQSIPLAFLFVTVILVHSACVYGDSVTVAALAAETLLGARIGVSAQPLLGKQRECFRLRSSNSFLP